MDWVNELKTVNNQFNDKYLQRAQAMSGHQPGIVASLIAQTSTVFRILRNSFDARFAVALIDDTPEVPEFTTVENEWNVLTHQYNDAVNRYLNSGNEQEEDNNPNPE